jgi:hypothetical protein
MKVLILAVTAVAISTGAACAQHPLIEMFTSETELAKKDDAYCQSIRARGSDYTKCRMFLTKQRQDRATAWREGFGDSLSRAGEAMRSNQPTRCTTSGPYAYRTTSCY